MGLPIGRGLAPWIVVLGAFGALGCEERDEPFRSPATGGQGGTSTAPHDLEAGSSEPGPPPPDPCLDYDCIEKMTERLEGELGARERPIVGVIGSKCEEALGVGLLDGRRIRSPLCACMTNDDFSYYVGPEPIGCAVRGHTHECLMVHGEFGVCDPSDPDACANVCSELQARLEADATTSKSFSVRAARCEAGGFEGSVFPECTDAVVEIEGFCYPAAPSLSWEHWQDCELDDEAVLDAPAHALPYCDDIPASTPSITDCLPSCDDASDCILAQGCSLGPNGTGYGSAGRPRCEECNVSGDCLPTETCAHGSCVLAGRAECDLDSDCPDGEWCTPMGNFNDGEGRGNATLEVLCLP